MGSITIDSSGPRTALLRGEHLRDGGVGWTAELVRAAVVTAGLRARVRTNAQSAPDAWSIEVHVSGRPCVLVDVDTDGPGSASLDRLELSASRTWRGLTRNATLFEPRPWIGAVRISRVGELDAGVVEGLDQLVAARLLDASCIITVDAVAGSARSSSPTTSLEAFQAAPVGRCLYLATTQHQS